MELTDSGERGARRPRSGVSERDARDMRAGGGGPRRMQAAAVAVKQGSGQCNG